MKNNAVDTASLDETISYIQEQAFKASGYHALYNVKKFFQAEKQRLIKNLEGKPHFLRDRDSVLNEDSSLHYVEFDLPKRFDVELPGLPYQHPYLYTWLSDSYRYYTERLEPGLLYRKSLKICSAPTGRFNALAIPGVLEAGILVEDGLLNILQSFSNNLAYLLYAKTADGKYLSLSLEDIRKNAGADNDIMDALADAIMGYVIDGYSRRPPVIGDTYDKDFAIRHVLSMSLLCFVFEHELYHLKVWDSINPGVSNVLVDDRYRKVWSFFQSNVAAHLPVAITEPTFRKLYYTHVEEIYADYFAFAAGIRFGEQDNTVAPSADGMLAFFLIAGLIQHVLIKLDDPGFLQNLYSFGDLSLSLTAIVMRESHPYAVLRQREVMQALEKDSAYPVVQAEACKIAFIEEQLRKLIDKRIEQSARIISPHPKWQFGRSMQELV